MSDIIKFQGDEIEAVREGTDVWVALRDPCRALGLDMEGQRQRLARSGWAGTCVMQVPSPGGPQATAMVHLDSLPMWLATVQASRVKAAVRPKLIAYQKDCARVLRDHYFGPPVAAQAPEPAHGRAALSGALGDNSYAAREFKTLIYFSAVGTGVTVQRVRGYLARKSGVASYLRMTQDQAEGYRRQLDAVCKGHEPAPWPPAPKSQTDPRQRSLPGVQ